MKQPSALSGQIKRSALRSY
uniref:Uncharacterized protein n=1 Tax=Anguilla anguilla TaxID=7936 RepID=A0A0E9SLE9_ANGAN